MAYIIKNTSNKISGALMEEVMMQHQVGGWYISSTEKEALKKVLAGESRASILPCRIASVAAFFVLPSFLWL